LVVTIDDVTIRALVLLLIPLAICTSSASANGEGFVRLAPTQDVSLPFWCDWGYDWDERCYRDDGVRLPVGGEGDKVWRAALRFSTSSVPEGAAVLRATLHVFHDGRCLAARKTLKPCDTRTYGLTAHPILSSDWFEERELDFGPALSDAEIGSADEPQRLSFDLTDIVAEWVDGSRRNSGVLLKLSEDHEDYDVSGPSLPSSSFAQPDVRPQLELTYLPSSG
jgi:TGF-beta propeptide